MDVGATKLFAEIAASLALARPAAGGATVPFAAPPPPAAPRPVCALDFEASCLPGRGSFPIEVAIARPDGRTRAWLIRPIPAWLADGVWDAEAERLHGLSRERLLAEGLPAAQVVAELAAEAAGALVLSDHAPSDEAWMDTLCQAAAVRAPFVVESMEEVAYPFYLAEVGQEPDPDRVGQALRRAAARHPGRHRATPDAQRLMAFLLSVFGLDTDGPRV